MREKEGLGLVAPISELGWVSLALWAFHSSPAFKLLASSLSLRCKHKNKRIQGQGPKLLNACRDVLNRAGAGAGREALLGTPLVRS